MAKSERINPLKDRSGAANGYKWDYANVGGAYRVNIASGADIAHLGELDPKMWTVLSCPVQGLEIDSKSLAFIDHDSDGKIRISDITATASWITSVLRNPDDLLKGEDRISIGEIADNPEGEKLKASIRQILTNLGKEGDVISLPDVADPTAIFAKTRFNGDGIITDASAEDPADKAAIAAIISTLGGVQDRSGAPGVDTAKVEDFYKKVCEYADWLSSAPDLPFSDRTEEALEAYTSLDPKVKDFFLRSRLAAFSPESTELLDVRTSSIEAISTSNLEAGSEEIASYPLARITGEAILDLSARINPAWAAKMEMLKSIVFDEQTRSLTEDQWKEAGEKFSAYLAWKDARPGTEVEALGADSIKEFAAKNRKESLSALIAGDVALKEESENIDLVVKFLHIYRDFYRLLRNFVTFNDFYSKEPGTKAIFQSGRLIVDQRECHLCLRVPDPSKHNATAEVCGMFLVYCDCSVKAGADRIQIVAAVTVGDTGDIFVGKNIIYYDNSGREWDAVITKIVENPISIGQAFWSPYRRMSAAIENLISKSAADKDAKMMSGAIEKINAVPDAVPAAEAEQKPSPAAVPPFDIAKFAGIFAALGMALGMIGTALAALAKGIFALTWWQVLLAFAGVLLLISGPSMVLAWMKLRRRNIAPLLNANGWAVNAASRISIPFGETLTEEASFPRVHLKDPYAKAGMPCWKRWLCGLLSVLIVAAALWLANVLAPIGLGSPLSKQKDAPAVEQVILQNESEPL